MSDSNRACFVIPFCTSGNYYILLLSSSKSLEKFALGKERKSNGFSGYELKCSLQYLVFKLVSYMYCC